MNTFTTPGRWSKIVFHVVALILLGCLSPSLASGAPVTLSRGQPLPQVTLVGRDQVAFDFSQLSGRVKILNIVPQLNTPVCDEQTHRFSEKNEGLDEHLDILTISTNSSTDQELFAHKAGIRNVTFLSDAPAYNFGKQTGLLHPMHKILQRAVMIVDENNIIRYLEIVPMGQLPTFEAAYQAARRILKIPNE